jgi:TRAP-type C4-dicarboxylate transport system permease small subunit
MPQALVTEKINDFLSKVVDPSIKVLFAVAVLYFMWGVFVYVRDAENAESHKTGANHILWSTVGLFIMISFWAIMGFIKDLPFLNGR